MNKKQLVVACILGTILLTDIVYLNLKIFDMGSLIWGKRIS
jgi:hypothetical protein